MWCLYPIVFVSPSTMPSPEYESESDLTELPSDDDSSDDEVPLSKTNARRPPAPPSTTTTLVATIVTTRPSTREATARSQKKERGVRGARLSPPNNTQRSTHWLHRAHSFHFVFVPILTSTQTNSPKIGSTSTQNIKEVNFYLFPLPMSH